MFLFSSERHKFARQNQKKHLKNNNLLEVRAAAPQDDLVDFKFLILDPDERVTKCSLQAKLVDHQVGHVLAAHLSFFLFVIFVLLSRCDDIITQFKQ